jgi:hypothetical protein
VSLRRVFRWMAHLMRRESRESPPRHNQMVRHLAEKSMEVREVALCRTVV